ncbi:winged helix-turn-helix domain-containing protein [Streptomyces sp. NBC_00378]|uniref:winged helix-turn-helix domain-containing protein n=1 Tax=unclassified Streptomyces TaxID=2593676 RepID=UPI0022501709|nr:MULTISPECIES: winged helix-turn-helix domain-containing protein [unclassified Streptomyces]MCX5108789.1 winged helix-turn-helix domain-containing protein [Streptomyces sp. NBC_00378]
MQRVHFSAQDLARTVVKVAERPLVETLFALDLLARQGGGEDYASWRQRTTGRLGRRSWSLLTLARTLRPVPDLLHMAENAANPKTGTERQNLVAMLEDFHKVALAPYWDRVSAALEADCTARGRTVLAGGIERLLSTVHPMVRWSGGVLEIPSHRSQDVVPGGAGLLLAPSLFLYDRPVLIPAAGRNRPPVLAYPVAGGTAEAVLAAPAAEQNAADALGPLVGRTRAAIMKSLTESCTTTELGRRIGISAASASQHTSVLRSAGLITTHRRLNTARHSLTPLGAALLDGFHHRDLARAHM